MVRTCTWQPNYPAIKSCTNARITLRKRGMNIEIGIIKSPGGCIQSGRKARRDPIKLFLEETIKQLLNFQLFNFT